MVRPDASGPRTPQGRHARLGDAGSGDRADPEGASGRPMTRWIRRMLVGLLALGRRPADDRDLDDELQQYLAASVDAKVTAGVGRADALRAARAEVGSPAAIH